MGQLWQSKLLFRFGNMLKKCWSSGEYPFQSSHDHRFRSLWTPDLWTTTERAGPLPTKGLFNLRSPALGWLSKYYEYTVAKQNYEYTVAKQIGGGTEWVELFITLTKGWANQRTNSCCLSSRPGVRGLFSASCIEGSSLNTRWILGACSVATLLR